MNQLESVDISCPYCGEQINVLIDCSIDSQQYIEDCQVCCRPINLTIALDAAGIPHVTAHDENE